MVTPTLSVKVSGVSGYVRGTCSWFIFRAAMLALSHSRPAGCAFLESLAGKVDRPSVGWWWIGGHIEAKSPRSMVPRLLVGPNLALACDVQRR